MDVTVEIFDNTFKQFDGIDICLGFSLTLFDYTLSCERIIDQVATSNSTLTSQCITTCILYLDTTKDTEL